jgi:hypothetical protein
MLGKTFPIDFTYVGGADYDTYSYSDWGTGEIAKGEFMVTFKKDGVINLFLITRYIPGGESVENYPFITKECTGTYEIIENQNDKIYLINTVLNEKDTANIHNVQIKVNKEINKTGFSQDNSLVYRLFVF